MADQEFEFDFCPNTRVAEKIAPKEDEVKDMNGWVYHPKPYLPFRASYKVTLEGLRWYLDTISGNLDSTRDLEHNAGRLEAFYLAHRLYKPFIFKHEYLGNLRVRFSEPVSVPKALPNSGGLIPAFEVNFIHHTAEYS